MDSSQSTVNVEPKTSKRAVLIAVGGTIALIVVFAFVKYLKVSAAIAAAMSHTPPPETVTSKVAKVEDWHLTFEAVGSLTPVDGAVLSAELMGRVKSFAFTPGTKINAGDTLVELDSGLEDAELRAAQAQLDMATLWQQRQKSLREKNANSLNDLEKAELEFRTSRANVELAKAKLAKKKIIAPFAGWVGIPRINVGDMVKDGDAILSVQSYSPLYADFTLPQQDLVGLKVGQEVAVTTDAYGAKQFKGKVTALDSVVDLNSRSIRVRATIPNEEEQLRPGMFVSVVVTSQISERFLTIPASSISYAPYGDSVYVIEKMKNPNGEEYLGVRPQTVRLGRRRGDQVAVVSGLEEGTEIASSGTFKLRPGLAVQVNNSIMPGDSAAPTPADT